MKKLLVVIALFFIKNITAQDTKSLPENEFSLFAGPSFNNIKNDNISSDIYASSRGTTYFSAGINYCKYFNKNAGFAFGLEYSKYQNITEYKGAYRSDTKSVDSDNYLYYPVSEANYTDTRTIHAVEVPLALRLQVPISKQAEFFVDLGIKFNIIAAAKLKEKGTLDKKGAYPNPNFDNVFLYIEDDANYGFTSSTYNSTMDIPVNRVNASFVIGAGVKAKISDGAFLFFNPVYVKGLNDVNSKTNRPDYTDIFGKKSPYKKFTITEFVMKVGIGFKI